MKGQLLNLNYTGRTPHHHHPRSLYHPSQTPCGVCLFSLRVSPRANPVLCNEYLKHTFRHVYTACNSAACVILQHTLRHMCQAVAFCMYASLLPWLDVSLHECLGSSFYFNSHSLSSFLIFVSPRGRTPASFFFSSSISDKTKEIVEVFGYEQKRGKNEAY